MLLKGQEQPFQDKLAHCSDVAFAFLTRKIITAKVKRLLSDQRGRIRVKSRQRARKERPFFSTYFKNF